MCSSDVMHANAFSLAATVKILALKIGVNNILSNQFGISGAPKDWRLRLTSEFQLFRRVLQPSVGEFIR